MTHTSMKVKVIPTETYRQIWPIWKEELKTAFYRLFQQEDGWQMRPDQSFMEAKC